MSESAVKLEEKEESSVDVEKLEFVNLVSQLKAGKAPSKDQRNRLALLARKLTNATDQDFIATASALGAYSDTDSAPLTTTKAEMAVRIDTVTDWLRWGWTRAQIIAACASRWGVRHASAKKYIYSATKKLEERLERTRNAQEALLSDKFAECFAMARAKGDVGAMIEALDRQAKLLGLHRPPVHRIEFTGKDGQSFGVLNLPAKDGEIIDVQTDAPKQLREDSAGESLEDSD